MFLHLYENLQYQKLFAALGNFLTNLLLMISEFFEIYAHSGWRIQFKHDKMWDGNLLLVIYAINLAAVAFEQF